MLLRSAKSWVMRVSNPIGTKFKFIIESHNYINDIGFKSHRDKVQITHYHYVIKEGSLVSNPIGTKFKSKIK